MKQAMLYASAAALALLASAPAQSAVLVADSGWQDDQVNDTNEPSDQSPWTFTVAVQSILSVTDDFIPGDIYTLSGDVTGSTTFYAGSPSDVQASGDYGDAWLDGRYSKLALSVGPGTYSFSIVGNGAAGYPSGFGVRLDTAPTAAVPEPASWAMMIGGLGVAGGALRRRRSNVRTTVRFA